MVQWRRKNSCAGVILFLKYLSSEYNFQIIIIHLSSNRQCKIGCFSIGRHCIDNKTKRRRKEKKIGKEWLENVVGILGKCHKFLCLYNYG